MAELLLELFSEEIPARMQARAAEDLKRLVTEKLKTAGLAFTRADSYATPRRLALVVDGLPLSQPDVTEEKRGPRVGAPEQAVQGFLKGAGLTSLDQCEKRDTGKGEFWFATVKKTGGKTIELLGALISGSLLALPWPKSMRWAYNSVSWVRPLHSIIATLDGDVVPGSLAFSDDTRVAFGDKTLGHRFLSSGEIQVAGFADYKVKLKECFVIVDPAERRAIIQTQAEKLAAAEGLRVKPDEALLDEVVGLVEWPVLLMGKIDQAFMDIPPEVLTTTMRTNQKYFALLDKNGKLAPRFLVAANIETKDRGKAIVAGNERVLRARLSDAKFFWDQDRKVKLEERVPALKDIVFHAKLGTVADKVARLQTLAAELAAFIPGADVDQVRSAALLAKADLTSGMVGEFPELQGIMGRYYALHEGEKPTVADAIAEHYQPLGPNDRCPTSPVSMAVALADKIDSLAGFFAIDEKPTGSKDPFALRRAALGVIRLIVENKLRLPLVRMFGVANQLFRNQNDKIPSLKSEELLDFFADRLKVALREKGVRHDLISAIFSLGGEDDLVRLLARVNALKSFLDTDDGANLLVAYRRASNIVKIEEKKDKVAYNGGSDAGKLQQAEEKSLHVALTSVSSSGAQHIKAEKFGSAMSELAKLRQPVDAFFDKVTVNSDDKDLRANRLRLLSEIRTTLNSVADFSQIEG
jgi:glycyl-tRNA synthetase beta chain